MRGLISFVLPVYNESASLMHFYDALSRAIAKKPAYKYELIFIDDGSTDSSPAVLNKLHAKDSRVVIVSLSRNFGHQMAVTAGLDYAQGDAVIIMDTDLQDPPAVAMRLVQKWEQGFDVVYAKRRSRQDSLAKRTTAALFYRLLARLSDIEIPANTGDFRLLDKKVVAELQKFGEQDRFMRGLVSYVGFRQTAVLFDRQKRFAGKSGYSFSKMWKLAIDGILGFSNKPLKLIARVGLFFSFLSFAGIVYATTMKFIDPGHVVPGWAFITISVLLMGGVQLIVLGMLGSYIGRIYNEVKHRPLYITASVNDRRQPATKTRRHTS